MKGFELAATLVATSDFQNFLLARLRAPEDPPGRGTSSVLAPPIGTRLPAQDLFIFTKVYADPCPPTW